MVAIISGNGLGLFNTSLDVLGSASGQTALGQANGKAYVNTATGNLSVQFLDETVSGTGADLLALRTYNSLGAWNDGDKDGWRWQAERKVTLSGSVNNAGSTVTRTLGDGSETTFSWDGSKYVSTAGSGAHDTLTWNAAGTEWVINEDGSGDNIERYNGTTGWIKSIRDSSGNGFDYTFTGNKLATVKDLQSNQTLEFSYGTNGKLERLDTRTTNSSGTLILTRQVYYGYDSVQRLSSVTTDLSPSDNLITDGKVYTTSYTYSANYNGAPSNTSTLIASITQSDGTSVNFTYDSINRVATVTDQGGTTTFAYSSPTITTTSISTATATNALGNRWTYTYDTTANNNRLLKVESDIVGSISQSTTYGYDSLGNVTSVKDGRGNITTYTPDPNGNRIKEVDALGNTISRTFSATNHLLTETRYTVPSLTAPSGAETTRYVYDSADRLRFTVSAEGRVTETRYYPNGLVSPIIQYAGGIYAVDTLAITDTLSEAQLNTWVSTQDKTKTQVTSFIYDNHGNLTKKINYATVDSTGAGVMNSAADVTEYVYSEYGQLLQTFSDIGTNHATKITQSSFVYDGLGRVISAVNSGVTTTTTYNGVNITVTNTATGLTVTSTTDSRGRLLSVVKSGDNATRTTNYIYDTAGRLRMTQDATGARSYLFYDAAGRVNAKVDAVGSATVYTYDGDGRVLTETQYATPTNTTSWFNNSVVTINTLSVGIVGSGANVITDSAYDRVTTYTYDAAGRLATTTKAFEAPIVNTYDGESRLIQTTQNSRITKYYYDKDGRKIGMLDAERYLTQYFYDAAGRLTETIRFGSIQLSVAQQANFSFINLRLLADNGPWLATCYFYDSEGRQVGVVDEQGFLTETVYDSALNRRQTIQYFTPVTVAKSSSLTVIEGLSSVRSRAGTSETTTTNYDNFGRVDSVVTHDGTISRNIYDTAGRLIRQVQAEGSADQRASRTRYNAFNEITGVVSGEGEAAESDITTAINNYGTRYDIDGVGRKIAEYGPSGQKTFLFYDAAGNLTYTVKARAQLDQMGHEVDQMDYEVAQMGYNAFGQISSIRLYSKRLNTSGLTLTGGTITQQLRDRINAISDDSSDNVSSTLYNQIGAIEKQTDGEGFTTTNMYNSYGDAVFQRRIINQVPETSVLSQTLRDNLGRVLSIKNDIDKNNIDGTGVFQSRIAYDGYGRIVGSRDANGNLTSKQYLDNGRTIVITDPLGSSKRTEIDALGRTVKSIDALGNTTIYSYDDSNRKMTVINADGTSITTWKTRTGETLQVQDGNGNITKYSYTKDGKLDTIKDALDVVTTDNRYDNSGRLYETTDANNVVTRYGYDAANRVTLKTVDQYGLKISTSYSFNGQGQQETVTEGVGTPEASTTKYLFNRKGQIQQIIVDPDNLQLSTKFTYDGLGQTTKVEKGTVNNPSQQTTIYKFDNLGRKTQEQISDTNEITRYSYDNNSNLIQKIDANNNVTSYVYDAANQLRFTIDATGAVSERIYDTVGNVVREVQYANKLSAAEIASTTTLNTLLINRVNNSIFTNPGSDGVPQGWSLGAYRASATAGIDYSYDWTIQNLPGDDSTVYLHQNGRDPVDAYQELTQAIPSVTPGKEYMFSAYTGAQRATVGVGIVWIDASGNIIGEATAGRNESEAQGGQSLSVYKRTVGYGIAPDNAASAVVYLRKYNTNVGSTDSWLFAAHAQFEEVPVSTTQPTTWVKSLIKTDAADRTTNYVYDKANHLRFTIDATGAVRERIYDAVGNVVSEVQYANKLSPNETSSTTALNTFLIKRINNSIFSSASNNGAPPGWSLGSYLASATAGVDYSYDLSLLNLPADDNTVYLHQDGRGPENAYQELTQAIPSVTPGKEYMFSAYTGAQRATVGVGIVWIDASGNIIGEATAGRNESEAPGGQSLATYKRTVGYGIAPDNAVSAVVYLRKYNTNVGSTDSWLFAAHAQFEGVPVGTTQPTTWIKPLIKTDPADRTTNYVYDKTGRLRFTVDTTGAVSERIYDAVGNVIHKVQYANKLASRNIAQLQTDAADQTTSYVYDKAGRLRFTVDAEKFVSERIYDAIGNVVRETQYATKLQFVNRVSPNDLSSIKTDPDDRTTCFVYDDAKHLRFTIDATGAVSERMYDAVGNVIREVRYANTLSPSEIFGTSNTPNAFLINRASNSIFSNPGSDGAPQGWTLGSYLASASAGVNYAGWTAQGLPSADNTAYLHQNGRGPDNAYQELTQAIPSVIPGKEYMFSAYTGAHRATVGVGIVWIDANGKIIGEATAGRNEVEAQGGSSLASYKRTVGYGIAPDNAVSAVVYLRKYNTNAGSTDSWMFAVHAQFEEVPVGTTQPTTWVKSLIKTDPKDRTTSYMYDKANHLRFTVDATGAVSERIYDAIGNVVREVRYANKLSPTESASTTILNAMLVNRASNSIFSNPGSDGAPQGWKLSSYRASATAGIDYSYDWTVQGLPGDDSTVYLHQNGRDPVDAYQELTQAIPSVIPGKQYMFSAYTGAHRASVGVGIVWIDASGNIIGEATAGRNDVEAKGGQSLTTYKRTVGYGIAPDNAVSAKIYLRKYNTNAGESDSWMFAAHAQFEEVPVGTTQPTTWIRSLINPGDQTTSYVYDKVGRLLSTRDALGNSEYYEYDAFGNRTKLTNKLTNVWTYTYDKANHVIDETSPQVVVASIDNTGAVTTRLQSLITHNTYDTFGNVASRTEAYNTDSACTTSYQYDKLNRQTITTLPGWYDPATGSTQASRASGSFQRTIEVTYDSFGNAVQNKTQTDLNTFIYQTKIYDKLGRVIYDIDALNQVTGYTYNAFGNQHVLTRYFNIANSASNTIYSINAIPVTNSSYDRTLTTTYDRVGQKKSVTLSDTKNNFYPDKTKLDNSQFGVSDILGTPLTVFVYNSFGDLIRESSKINTTEWSTTYHYYDALGQKIADVDALGYYTAYNYDAFGNLIQQDEYAQAISLTGVNENNQPSAPVIAPTATSGDNRTTVYGYDAVNRRTDVTRKNLAFYKRDVNDQFGNATYSLTKSRTHTWHGDYDALGNLVTEKTGDLDNASPLNPINTTTTHYNALSQIDKVTDLSRKVAGKANAGLDPFNNLVSASPETTFTLNAFGQIVIEERSAGNGRGVEQGDKLITTHRYDVAGNEVATTDALGSVTYKQYDAANHVIKESQNVSASFSDWAAGNYNNTIEKRYTYDLVGRQTGSFDVYRDASNIQQQSGNVSTYNHFGEVFEERKVWGPVTPIVSMEGSNLGGGSATLNTYHYDNAGRVIDKTGQDGLTLYYYDLLGHNTRVEQSGNSVTTDGTPTRITETVYDTLGRATTQRLPEFSGLQLATNTLPTAGQSVTTLKPLTSQTYDRWGNVTSRTDSARNITYYTYNQDNKVISETLPTTTVYKADGSYSLSAVVHEIHYDLFGRSVEDVQNNRKRRSEYNEAGQLTASIDGTNRRTDYAYDSFGNQIASRNGVGTVMLDTFDAKGNQLRHSILRKANTDYTLVWNGAYNYNSLAPAFTPIEAVLQSFQYDQAGRRIADGTTASNATTTKTITEQVWIPGNTGEIAGPSHWETRQTTKIVPVTAYNYYKYDERGNIVKTRNSTGIVKESSYDFANRKTGELDAKGYTLSWEYDSSDYRFGQLTSHTDLGNHITKYTYNDFGQILTDTALSGHMRIYAYTESGLVKSITENWNETYNPNAIYSPDNGVTFSPYSMVDTVTDTTQYDYDIGGQQVRQIQKHSRNGVRPTSLTRVNGTHPGEFYDYYTSTTPINYSYTYETDSTYDELGRMSQVSTVANGVLSRSAGNGADKSIGAATLKNLAYHYDGFGNRLQVIADYTGGSLSGPQTTRYNYDNEGRVIYENGMLIDYDAAGRRLHTETAGQVRFANNISQPPTSVDTYLTLYTYTDAGQIQTISGRTLNHDIGFLLTGITQNQDSSLTLNDKRRYSTQGFLIEQDTDNNTITTNSYLSDGRMLTQYVTKNGKSSAYIDYTNSVDPDNGYDEVGNLKKYKYKFYNDKGVDQETVTYTIGYNRFDSYKEGSETATSSKSGSTPGNTLFSYDGRGNLNSITASGAKAFTRDFVSDIEGRIVAKSESGSPQNYVYVNGNQVAQLGKINQFDFGLTGATGHNNDISSTPGQYVVNAGDNLFTIAQAVWGDSTLWYLIADANGINIAPDAALTDYVGQNLRIPNVARVEHNNSTTFKPYSAQEIIGDTTPSPTPPPPPKHKCGGLVQLVSTVLATMAAIVTAPAGPHAAAAAFSATKNYSQQYLQIMADGDFDWRNFGESLFNPSKRTWLDPLASGLKKGQKIDYESVVISAAAAYAGSYAGAAIGGNTFASSFVSNFSSAAASYSTNYALNKLAGRKPTWRNRDLLGSIANSYGGPFAGPAAGFVVRRLGGDDTPWSTSAYLQEIAQDAFGNYIGNAIVDVATRVPTAASIKADANAANWNMDSTGWNPNFDYADDPVMLASLDGGYSRGRSATDTSINLNGISDSVGSETQDFITDYRAVEGDGIEEVVITAYKNGDESTAYINEYESKPFDWDSLGGWQTGVHRSFEENYAIGIAESNRAIKNTIIQGARSAVETGAEIVDLRNAGEAFVFNEAYKFFTGEESGYKPKMFSLAGQAAELGASPMETLRVASTQNAFNSFGLLGYGSADTYSGIMNHNADQTLNGVFELAGGALGVYGGLTANIERPAIGYVSDLSQVGDMPLGFEVRATNSFAPRAGSDIASHAKLKELYHSLDEGLHQQAASKGYPGIRITENGNPDFAGSNYLYPLPDGKNIVTIPLQGSRYLDFKLANELAGLPGAKAPSGYTWHHLDDFNSSTVTSTMQLIEQGAHKATYSHYGSVSQYEKFFGVKYK